ncbi:MAG: hypothetical protein L6Q92_16065, partial [Phycisphaerae bacterium]|nr:hypothetical protein [Phycisphaerae bacterium]
FRREVVRDCVKYAPVRPKKASAKCDDYSQDDTAGSISRSSQTPDPGDKCAAAVDLARPILPAYDDQLRLPSPVDE